jgi:hypothetical protein
VTTTTVHNPDTAAAHTREQNGQIIQLGKQAGVIAPANTGLEGSLIVVVDATPGGDAPHRSPA